MSDDLRLPEKTFKVLKEIQRRYRLHDLKIAPLVTIAIRTWATLMRQQELGYKVLIVRDGETRQLLLSEAALGPVLPETEGSTPKTRRPLTPKLVESIRSLVDYSFAKEQDDAETMVAENGPGALDGHIFCDIVALDNWLDNLDNSPESYLNTSPESP